MADVRYKEEGEWNGDSKSSWGEHADTEQAEDSDDSEQMNLRVMKGEQKWESQNEGEESQHSDHLIGGDEEKTENIWESPLFFLFPVS